MIVDVIAPECDEGGFVSFVAINQARRRFLIGMDRRRASALVAALDNGPVRVRIQPWQILSGVDPDKPGPSVGTDMLTTDDIRGLWVRPVPAAVQVAVRQDENRALIALRHLRASGMLADRRDR